jgi:WD40 repeat protein/serine/threonine protein kinase
MSLPSYVGRYAVRHEIARGGFAVVVLAWDEELDSAVALKILDYDPAGAGEEFQRRFIEEARMLRRIRSHHVVTVHDVGRLNDGRPYFVMDYADRGTLADWLARRPADRPQGAPAADTRELMVLVDALADGLSAIHRAGVVHRDIKPANILFQSLRQVVPDPDMTVRRGPAVPATAGAGGAFHDARILVGDLGIAKDVIRSGALATMLGGTPAYHAPEQMDPEALLTPAADIYAATAVLYQLLTGVRPPKPEMLEQQIPRGLDRWREVLGRGLALDPIDRYASIQSWRAAIHDVLAEEAAETTARPSATSATFLDEATSRECPYKGLNAFQPEDADRFHGREALTEELIRRIQQQKVLVVGGASGSGKSSLVRAGLIPALRAGAGPGGARCRIVVMTPGRDALAELYFQLVHALEQAPGAERPMLRPEDLSARPALARRLAHPSGSEPPLVLCIDQFEELFTLSPPSQRLPFIEALSAMTDPADSQVRIVLAVRADYYAACAQVPWLAERFTDNQVLVGPMNPAELRRAISEPARRAGLYLERNLIDAIIDEAGNEAGSLPLISHALVETWMRRKGATLTLEGFRAAGGVAGAIAQTADVIFEQRFGEAEQAATRRLFLRLVTPGEGAGDTRRVVERAEIESDSAAAVMARIVEPLTEARLLTVDKRVVQIAHEALLRSWPRLRGWIDETRDDLRVRQRLIRHAEEWRSANHEPDLLLRGTPLLSALDWLAKNPDQVGAQEQEFIEASAEAKRQVEAVEEEKRARSRRLRRSAVAALSFLAAGATAASVVAFLGYQEAQRNGLRAVLATEQADARFALALGAVANGLVESDPLLALFLAGEAVARAESEPPGYDARAAMIAARLQLEGDGPFLLGSPIPVGDALSLALSPDGAFLAAGQRDGAIMIVDTATRMPVGAPLTGHDGGVEDLEFSPDGSRLVSSGDDGTIRLWPVEDGFIGAGEVVARFDDVIWGVAFDPVGDKIASVSEDGSVRLWNADTAAQIGAPLVQRTGDFLSVAFSPDGTGLMVGTGEGEIWGWSLPSGKPIMQPILGAHSSDVWELVFSPTGDRIATASSDGTSALLTYPEGKVVGHAFAPEDGIQCVEALPDGSGLVGGGADGRVRIWSFKDGATTAASAVGHDRPITEIALSADGHLMATLGGDQAARLWMLFEPIPPAVDRTVAGATAKGVALGDGGRLVAAGDETGLVQLWRDGDPVPAKLAGHEHQVWALALSPDGKTLASADRSGEVIVWDIDSGAVRHRMKSDGGATWWVGFAADGKLLATANDTGVEIWNAETMTRAAAFPQESGQVTRAAVSLDGKRLVTASSDGHVRLFDLVDNRLVREFAVIDDVVWSVAFSRDGQLLASAGSDEVVSLWDAATGERRTSFAGHSGGAMDVAFLSDGVTLAVVDRNGQLHLWDVLSERRLAPPIRAHWGASWRLAVGPEGNRFATAGDDGKVRVWDALSAERACEIGVPAFDRERRREYFGEASHPLSCAAILP